MISYPRKKTGRFAVLMNDILGCKIAKRCPSLKIRQFYFEPNPFTISAWKKKSLFEEGFRRQRWDGAEFITYSFKPTSRLLANNSPRETALVTAVGHMPNTFDTATVVMPSSRTAQ